MDLVGQIVACAECRAPLSRYTHPDGSIEWIHTPLWRDFDHDPNPVPGTHLSGGAELVCDFCGSPQVRWSYTGSEIIAVLAGGILPHHNFGTRWAGCEECDSFIRRRDITGLLADVRRRSSLSALSLDTQLQDLAWEARRDLWMAFIPTIHRRELLPPPPAPPAEIPPGQLPKVRDRLARFWGGEDAVDVLASLTADTPIHLPGHIVDRPGEFATPVPRPDRDTLARFCRHTAHTLPAANLYWVSTEFTAVAAAAGRNLPDLTITSEELPAPHGLLVWQLPIAHTTTPYPVEVTAAHWATTPSGVWVCFYTRPEAVFPAHERARVRSVIGWLMPATPPLPISFDGELGEAQRSLVATLLATWLLLHQPGVADVTHQAITKKKLRKAYARAGRPVPTVRIIDIRRRINHTSPGDGQVDSGEHPTRTYSVRSLVSGHWRTQRYGPKLSKSRRIFIHPYLRGPEGAPLRVTETVKVLR